jgi:aminoglycoside 6'-N-acetyltransferase
VTVPSAGDGAVGNGAAGDLTFRPLTRADLPLLARWLAEPHVEPWWREDFTPEGVEVRYGPGIDGADPTEVFVVEHHGTPLGLVQRFRLADDAGWAATMAPTLPPAVATDRTAGIDYLIADAKSIGRGLGTRMLEAFTADTFERYPDVDTVSVAVLLANRRSWRALEKIGYVRVYEGEIDSDDPADEGVNVVYVRHRPRSEAAGSGHGAAGGPSTTP